MSPGRQDVENYSSAPQLRKDTDTAAGVKGCRAGGRGRGKKKAALFGAGAPFASGAHLTLRVSSGRPRF